MLESSAHLDGRAHERRKIEARVNGVKTGEKMNVGGKSADVIQLSANSYSFGITQSAQILAGQAAELALKFAFESENPGLSAPATHRLDRLFNKLTLARKRSIEADYLRRTRQHQYPPLRGWQTAEKVFNSGKNYPVLFRYLTEEGQASFDVQPQFLREAVCSVLASLGVRLNWASGPA